MNTGMTPNVDKDDFVLAALSPAMTEGYTPVQVQKLFFLAQKQLDMPGYNFQPYDYGPYDKEVYSTLECLQEKGFVQIVSPAESRTRIYRLTDLGCERGAKVLNALPLHVQEYLSKLSSFVRSLNFSQLVSAVYKAYPEMKVNSVFRG